VTAQIFPFEGGIVYRLFLFHIACPLEWPIADQNVFRAFEALYGMKEPRTIDEFKKEYVPRFKKLAENLRRKRRVNRKNKRAVLDENKKLDSALMMFGKFLRRYDPAEQQT
jgi:hypothetical protein